MYEKVSTSITCKILITLQQSDRATVLLEIFPNTLLTLNCSAAEGKHLLLSQQNSQPSLYEIQTV